MNESNQSAEEIAVRPDQLAELLVAIESGDLDNSKGKEVFQFWLENSGSNLEKAKDALGIETVDQGELESLCRVLLDENEKVVKQFKEGNTKALGALIGAAKKKNPNADPRLVREICQKIIETEL